ncbi:MAG: PHP domain-containing protein [Armatimonadetes bacterium]|nr:PHP domain-containing protein [Armatimonadota bacterium]
MAVCVAADLHVHSALSPCAGDDMRPPAVLLTAERRGVGIIGVVDHNSAGNAGAFLEAARAFAVRVFVGLEVESAEGVHILALFDNAEAAADMDAAVAAHLPGWRNQPDVLGNQILVDAFGNEIGCDDRLLLTATSLTVEQVAAMTRERGGMPIPAHIDRELAGLLPVLGFVPPGVSVEVLEVSRHMSVREARARWPELEELPLIVSSDAHCLDDIGTAVTWVSAPLAAAEIPALEWGRCLAANLLGAGG